MLSSNKPLIFIVGGLLFGDEGKGTTVEYLAHKYKASLVVRYNGGPQAMHHVVFSNNTFHCFSQFGSGSFFPYCKTLLSKYMVISPHTLIKEMEFLKKAGVEDIDKKIFIDLECVIVTPLHKLMNRITEILRGKNSHGTTGMGVGVAIDDAYNKFGNKFPMGELFQEKNQKTFTCLLVKDLLEKEQLFQNLQQIMSEKLQQVREILRDFQKNQKLISDKECLEENQTFSISESKGLLEKAQKFLFDFVQENTVDSLYKFYLDFSQMFSFNFVDSEKLIAGCISKGENIIMEGAQGALLDRVYGFYPHITKSLCSSDNALDLLKNINSNSFQPIKIGVLRAFSTRHGNGPFLSHNPSWSSQIKEDHNQSSGWQGDFRIGPFDLVAARYGIEIFNPDYISLTCLDKLILGCVNDEEIAKLPLVNAYKFISKEENDEEDFFCDKCKNIENNDLFIKKKSFEKAWKNVSLTKKLKKMFGSLIYLNDVDKVDLNEHLIKTISEETEKKLTIADSKIKIQIAQFVGYIEKQLKVPIKILSFGPTYSDKICLF